MYNKLLKSMLPALGLLIAVAGFSQGKQFKVLLFTKTNGFHHESINEGVDAIRKLGDRHFFDVSWQEDPGQFNDRNLEQYAVIIFLNTTGDILNEEQQAAFERFIQSGKGFVGIHSASDTEYDWAWYTKLVGHMFHIHPAIQTARLKVLDRKFPGLEYMPDTQLWTDEWYEFDPATTDGLNYIISVDESSYNPKVQWGQKIGNGMGDLHPIAWYHNYDGGRSFYTALGHLPAKYSEDAFLEHLYGGIYWAATGKM
ncbi:MAG TPA: ThuA domain-containing protein [Flavilitoribacter sp.]|nr:ThuA domain-containing protein [Flavilitoribacter sp.]